jgi:hypothetical protein
VQQLVFEEPYSGGKKALRLSYVINDTETALQDQTEPGGLPVFSEPNPPLAAELQAHLETAPGVSAGDIVVTGGPDAADRLGTQTNPYTITYTGNLATTDVADLVVGEFQGWPPRSWLDAILEFASGLGGDGEDGDGGETGDEGGGSPLDDFLADLDVNAILESITDLFPGPPTITTLTQGEAPAEAEMSGPLCGAGTVTVTVGAGVQTTTPPAQVASATQTPAAAPAATAVSAQPTFTG